MGDYNNCRYNGDQYIYFTTSVINLLVKGQQNMGLCAPIECRQDLENNTYSQDVQDSLNEAFRNATNSTFSPFVKLHFFNPETVKPKMGLSNYLVIALVLGLVGLGVVGSVVGRVTKN